MRALNTKSASLRTSTTFQTSSRLPSRNAPKFGMRYIIYNRRRMWKEKVFPLGRLEKFPIFSGIGDRFAVWCCVRVHWCPSSSRRGHKSLNSLANSGRSSILSNSNLFASIYTNLNHFITHLARKTTLVPQERYQYSKIIFFNRLSNLNYERKHFEKVCHP